MLSDWLAYDQGGAAPVVADLKLNFVYQRNAGDGPLRLQMTKRGECFTAELSPGKVTLTRQKVVDGQGFRLGDAIWSAPMEASVPELNVIGKPVAVEFENVDYRVTVRINSRDAIRTTDQEYTPDVFALYKEARAPREYGNQRSIVRIVAANQTSKLEHVRLAKDVYYLNIGGSRLDPNGATSQLPWYATVDNVMELGPDEYFVLGDNSKVSLDARFWGAPVNLPREGDYHAGPGRVPGRFLLGKAFFVYWPAGYRPPSLSFGIEPDFGDMRFIR